MVKITDDDDVMTDDDFCKSDVVVADRILDWLLMFSDSTQQLYARAYAQRRIAIALDASETQGPARHALWRHLLQSWPACCKPAESAQACTRQAKAAIGGATMRV